MLSTQFKSKDNFQEQKLLQTTVRRSVCVSCSLPTVSPKPRTLLWVWADAWRGHTSVKASVAMGSDRSGRGRDDLPTPQSWAASQTTHLPYHPSRYQVWYKYLFSCIVVHRVNLSRSSVFFWKPFILFGLNELFWVKHTFATQIFGILKWVGKLVFKCRILDLWNIDTQ